MFSYVDSPQPATFVDQSRIGHLLGENVHAGWKFVLLLNILEAVFAAHQEVRLALLLRRLHHVEVSYRLCFVFDPIVVFAKRNVLGNLVLRQ